VLEFENYAPDLILSVDQEVQIYHIAQEALANVAKHSHAQHAWLTLDMQHGQYVLTVTDDGTGTAQRSADSSFGRKIMQERAERLGGELIVTSTPGEGTTVQLKLPMACSLEEDE
jgi:signal transduction histidine kinase